MTEKNLFSELFSSADFTQMFENYNGAPIDFKALMESQMRNVQALSEAQQVTVDHLQSLAQRQSEFLSQIVEDNSKLAKEMMSEGSPETKLAKNADLFKELYEKSVQNMHEISEMMNVSNQKATGILNKRVSASVSEFKDTLESTTKAA